MISKISRAETRRTTEEVEALMSEQRKRKSEGIDGSFLFISTMLIKVEARVGRKEKARSGNPSRICQYGCSCTVA